LPWHYYSPAAQIAASVARIEEAARLRAGSQIRDGKAAFPDFVPATRKRVASPQSGLPDRAQLQP